MIYQRIKYFLKTVEAGSFTKAAGLLYISPQALTKQVALLEEELGGKLLERSRKGITLTELGEFAKDRFSEADAVFQNAVRQVEAHAAAGKPELNIGFFSALPKENILTPIVSFLFANYPQYKINFELMGLDEGLRRLFTGGIDLLFTNISDEDAFGGMKCYSFVSAAAKVVVSLNHPWAMKESVTVEDLSKGTFLKQEAGNGQKPLQSGGVFYESIPCKETIPVPNFDTIMEFLKMGTAFAVFPMLFTDAERSHLKAFDYPGKCPLFHSALLYDPENRNRKIGKIAEKIADDFELEDLGLR